MRIGVIQASSQRAKNQLLYQAVRKNAGPADEVVNFGCFADEAETYSYVEISIEVGLLLASSAVDFVVTGCSSGQGMMLACNNLPGVICGYLPSPGDAYLFGRINGGNAASVPLGLNFGWGGEINLNHTMEALFCEPFGNGYPPEESGRKRADMEMVRQIGSLSRIPMAKLLGQLDNGLLKKALSRKNLTSYILANGRHKDILHLIDAVGLYGAAQGRPGD